MQLERDMKRILPKGEFTAFGGSGYDGAAHQVLVSRNTFLTLTTGVTQACKTTTAPVTKRAMAAVHRYAKANGRTESKVYPTCESRTSVACSYCKPLQRLVGPRPGWRHCKACGRYATKENNVVCGQGSLTGARVQ